MSDPVWVIVVAAGSGQRFGGHKQFLELSGRPLLSWSLSAASAVADGVVLVVPPERLDEIMDPTAPLRTLVEPPTTVVAGGATRADSVRAGLAAVPAEAAIIVVHDAARPLATERLFMAVVDTVRAGAGGAIPGLPIVDTVKRVRDGEVIDTLDRSELVRVQTPQAFRASLLRAAHSSKDDATDDARLVEALGATVTVVPGEDSNMKITTPEDLMAAERLIADRRTAAK